MTSSLKCFLNKLTFRLFFAANLEAKLCLNWLAVIHWRERDGHLLGNDLFLVERNGQLRRLE